jgi:hypothetical protein
LPSGTPTLSQTLTVDSIPLLRRVVTAPVRSLDRSASGCSPKAHTPIRRKSESFSIGDKIGDKIRKESLSVGDRVRIIKPGSKMGIEVRTL